jgi:hypothetical protein
MDIMKMNPKEFDKYDKRCNVIKNLILKDYINDKFDFIRNPETLYIEIVINNNSKITLLPDSNWKEIKRHIDKKIIVQRNGISQDCIICCETIQKNVTCSKCSNNCCGKCYINLFKSGKGVITCPHCRYSYGNTMSEYMIQMGVNEIKHKLGKY